MRARAANASLGWKSLDSVDTDVMEPSAGGAGERRLVDDGRDRDVDGMCGIVWWDIWDAMKYTPAEASETKGPIPLTGIGHYAA